MVMGLLSKNCEYYEWNSPIKSQLFPLIYSGIPVLAETIVYEVLQTA